MASYYVGKDKMEYWKAICQAYAKKVGAKLLFVNEISMGIEYPNGDMRHIYLDELARML